MPQKKGKYFSLEAFPARLQGSVNQLVCFPSPIVAQDSPAEHRLPCRHHAAQQGPGADVRPPTALLRHRIRCLPGAAGSRNQV